MSTGTLLSMEEYLNTSYSPDREYRDGMVLERNVGDNAHSELQALLAGYLVARRRQWNIRVYTELRIKIRETWCPLPDVCVYTKPGFEGRYPSQPPLLWIEILSQDDSMVEMWKRATELIELGVPYVWIIDPTTLESELRTAEGTVHIADKTLRIPGHEIAIPLIDVMQD